MSELRVSRVTAAYGAIRVLYDVDFSAAPGEIVALLGPNGAGKTTLLRTISGLVPVRSGEITFAGRSIRRLRPSKIARLGICHVPEGRGTFTELSVAENLRVGAMARQGRGRRGSADDVYQMFPVLYDRREQKAGSLSGGEQQMLAFGRTLMSDPKVLLLDEPSMGLAPRIVHQILEVLVDVVREMDIAVILVEQNVELALGIADRAGILTNGRIALEGPAAELRQNADVAAAYLGGAPLKHVTPSSVGGTP